jgi:hypothetical protein
MPITPEQITELKNDLTRKVVNVTFKKMDGELRTMRCTRQLSMVPAEHQPKIKRRASPDVAVVFDLEKNDWRSFHYDSVRKFKVDVPATVTAKKR